LWGITDSCGLGRKRTSLFDKVWSPNSNPEKEDVRAQDYYW
jgi:hypothetical protein